MNDHSTTPFKPLPQSGLVSWIHLGDLHMVERGKQNYRDLQAIVDEINANFAGKGISFVFLPGDIADNGSAQAYEAVRECLDQLQLPWCGIVGDHDVHERSFQNFQSYISNLLYSAFTVGHVRFFRLNTFSEPRPDSFIVNDEQLQWLERELKGCGDLLPVVLMHCYPSDLKQGGDQLTRLLHTYGVRLVDMGHTHYNEISNDGHTLFSATRSTGQIEEGPVGYSVLSLDGDTLSWQFVRLGNPFLVAITSPSDDRLVTEATAKPLQPHQPLSVRVKVWSKEELRELTLHCDNTRIDLAQGDDATLWSGTLLAEILSPATHTLNALATDTNGKTAPDQIRFTPGKVPSQHRSAIDQDNALGAWADRDLLGTQLGPNKNGRKW